MSWRLAKRLGGRSAVLRVLARHLALTYVLLAILLIVVGLALLRAIHIVIPRSRHLNRAGFAGGSEP